MNEDTIPEGDVSAPEPTSPVDDILKRWGVDEETPSTDVEDTTPDPEAEAEGPTEDEDLDLEEETPEADPAPTPEPKTKRVASEDDEVVIKVDGEERRASVKELQRLYGQEASLTRKGQELSNHRKVADDQSLVAMGVLTRMYEKAAEAAKPYENIDLFKASRELEPEEFDTLRSEIAKATEQKRFFEEELKGYTDKIRQTHAEHIRSQAQTAIAAVKERIPSWSDKLYDDIRSYAVSEGMHPDVVNQIVDPSALVMLHKARLYDAAKAKAKAKTTPAATRVPPKSSRPAATSQRPQAENKSSAMDRFKRSGNTEDGVAALMARWASED